MAIILSMEAIIISRCLHCGNQFNGMNGQMFCCNGCQGVYTLLHDQGLEQFYNLKKTSTQNKPQEISFSHLDDIQPITNFVQFYIEGIHCIGCHYILENLHRLNTGIKQSRFDFSKSVLTISLHKYFKLSEIANLISLLGYKPHFIKEDQEIAQLQKQNKKKSMMRIGVALACSGNIMILAIANYAGADGIWRHYFDLLSGIIALPAITYAAYPFYSNSINSLKQKRVSIDLPIGLAIVMGSLVSFYSLYTHQDHVYFDSITGLIFLLLSSRFIQKSIEEKAGNYFNKEQFFEKEYVQKYDLEQKSSQQVLCELIKPGDLISITQGEIIAFDGKVFSGEGFINEALLTGESEPKFVQNGDQLFQGTMNAGNSLIMQVEKTGSDSRINQMLKKIRAENLDQSLLSITDKIGTAFLASVILLGLLTVLYFYNQPLVGIERAITLFIVACPCALAIGTPLSFRQSYQLLFRKGIILKNMDPLEKILLVENIFLDKTGTLTRGEIKVTRFNVIELDPKNEEILYSLEKHSHHPIAVAITKYLEKRHQKISELPLQNFKEIPGKGIEASYKNNFYQILGHANGIALLKNNSITLQIELDDQLRDNTSFTINALKNLGYSPVILSGDQSKAVLNIKKKLGITGYSHLTPEDKAQIVKKFPNSLMVGDGANDALSLKEAYLSICMKGGLPLSLKVSDVYFANNDLTGIIDLHTVALETKKIIQRNLYLSLLYNVTAASLACSGLITPILAAIFMPMSSLTVIISNFIGTKKIRQMNRMKI